MITNQPSSSLRQVIAILLFLSTQPALSEFDGTSHRARNHRFNPPLYNITASSLYEAGYKHGHLASERIRAWFQGPEVQDLVHFVSSENGRNAFDQMRRSSANAFPHYVDEIKGIADGAKVSESLVWTALLMIELQNLMYNGENQTKGHCSDFSSMGKRTGQFFHGHNEDWSVAV
eukprot:UC4_evm1s275